jgi:hypothetical protein
MDQVIVLNLKNEKLKAKKFTVLNVVTNEKREASGAVLTIIC